ncbi:MAG: VOC family protein [Dietzia sp.]
MTRSQPLLVVSDVPASSRWYQHVLGAESGHGGDAYEQIVASGRLLLQLHSRAGDRNHGPLADPSVPVGNGVVMWFEVTGFDAALQRIADTTVETVEVEHPVRLNPDADHREIWLRDPDGYRVVLAGESGAGTHTSPGEPGRDHRTLSVRGTIGTASAATTAAPAKTGP